MRGDKKSAVTPKKLHYEQLFNFFFFEEKERGK